MIIDCHGHYTTAPKALEAWRNQQIAGIKDRLRLTSDQESYWPGGEKALPAIARLPGQLGRGYLLPFPVLPRERFRSIVQPTPMAVLQKTLPLRLDVFDAAGNKVSHLDAGTYTLNLLDHSAFHNFHLGGPGVDVSTSVDGIDWRADPVKNAKVKLTMEIALSNLSSTNKRACSSSSANPVGPSPTSIGRVAVTVGKTIASSSAISR